MVDYMMRVRANGHVTTVTSYLMYLYTGSFRGHVSLFLPVKSLSGRGSHGSG